MMTTTGNKLYDCYSDNNNPLMGENDAVNNSIAFNIIILNNKDNERSIRYKTRIKPLD